jgi:hypothetical protein
MFRNVDSISDYVFVFFFLLFLIRKKRKENGKIHCCAKVDNNLLEQNTICVPNSSSYVRRALWAKQSLKSDISDFTEYIKSFQD